MLVTITLPATYFTVLAQFGDLQTIANKAVDQMCTGQIPSPDTLDKVPRTTLIRRKVHIHNDTYIELATSVGARSTSVSVSRLLAHIVDYELFEQLGLTQQSASPCEQSKICQLLELTDKIERLLRSML